MKKFTTIFIMAIGTTFGLTTCKYNKPLRRELLAIWDEDQHIRAEWSSAYKKYGGNNSTVDSLVKVMKYKDSIHAVLVTKIIDEHGWVGKDEVGQQANNTLFIVIQHSDLKTQQKYLPVMRIAVKEGKSEARWLALLEDRVALGEGRKQVYGSQIYFDKKTNKSYVAPLEDPDNVDKRRHDVGLDPLAHYVKDWDIVWNVQEYKRMLPELEKLNTNH